MLKQIVSICFTTLFVLFLMAPTLVTVLDDSADVSVFFNASEEEEKGNKKNVEKELLFNESKETDLDISLFEEELDLEYYLKKYPDPLLKLISPPPKSFIL
ncbi:hypothetical protein [Tamlana crocina]|uniref:Uncharacterized protein n=1 Tax=Tamlana crocina TaxID=393006 RepID=A0ABX1DCN0_9FLAO|nr:hypothetical protein [Tamlana crocina]NJX16119.1 hypothetical protein [Tamlana crocina]